MRLKRNTTQSGSCKYALLRLDLMEQELGQEVNMDAIKAKLGGLARFLEFGLPETEEEFFVLKLKDVNAHHTLVEYASRAMLQDVDYAEDIQELAQRAGPFSPWTKIPD